MDLTPIIAGLISFFDSKCTIQGLAPGQDTFGEENGTWTNIDGLVDLNCMDASTAFKVLGVGSSAWEGAPSGSSPVTMVGPVGFLLAGFYPEILASHQAVVDGVTYRIDGIEFKSKALTKLSVTRVV